MAELLESSGGTIRFRARPFLCMWYEHMEYEGQPSYKLTRKRNYERLAIEASFKTGICHRPSRRTKTVLAGCTQMLTLRGPRARLFFGGSTPLAFHASATAQLFVE